MPPAPAKQLDRAELRKLLNAILLTSQDLDAFCVDYFPEVFQRFDPGMDRVSKLNLLLSLVENPKILQCLRAEFPQRVDQFFLEGQEPLIERRAKEQLEKVSRLYQDREVLVRYGHSPSEVDKLLEQEQRAVRRGPRLNAGEVLHGNFVLVRHLGEGAFAEVWLATDVRKPTDYLAIKVLHGSWSRSVERVKRFESGAREMKALAHKHIVKLFGEPSEFEGFHYFTMEYLAGGDLHEAVLRDQEGKHREQWLRAVIDTGTALTHAHSLGRIHRDVKPQNILLDEHKIARLGDFDLVLLDSKTRTTLTNAGMGTFDYAAPEQYMSTAHIDHRCDIYSLGRTAIFVLSGKQLPPESHHDRLAFLHSLALSSEIKEILIKATEWDPGKRYSTVKTFCDALWAAWIRSTDSTINNSPGLPSTGNHLIVKSTVGQEGALASEVIPRQSLAFKPAPILIPFLARARVPFARPFAMLRIWKRFFHERRLLIGLAIITASLVTVPITLHLWTRGTKSQENPADQAKQSLQPIQEIASQSPPNHDRKTINLINPVEDKIVQVVQPPQPTPPITSNSQKNTDSNTEKPISITKGDLTFSPIYGVRNFGMLDFETEIISEPPGAIVEIDGEIQGATPLKWYSGIVSTKSGRSGHHKLVLTLMGYQVYRQEINDINLRPIRAKLIPIERIIEINSVPKGADVYLDSIKVGQTPIILKRIDFSRNHVIEVKKSGFISWTHQLTDTEAFVLKNRKEVLIKNAVLEVENNKGKGLLRLPVPPPPDPD